MARSNCSCVKPRSERIFVPSVGCLWIEAPSSPSCSGVSDGALVATAVLPEVVDDVAGVVVLFLQATIAINSVRASIEFLIVLILSVAFAAFFLLLSRRTCAAWTAAVSVIFLWRCGRGGNEDRLRRWNSRRHRRLYEYRRLFAFVFSSAVPSTLGAALGLLCLSRRDVNHRRRLELADLVAMHDRGSGLDALDLLQLSRRSAVRMRVPFGDACADGGRDVVLRHDDVRCGGRGRVLRQTLIDHRHQRGTGDAVRYLRLHVRDEIGLFDEGHRNVAERVDELRRRDVGLIERAEEGGELVLGDAGDVGERGDRERHRDEREEIVRVAGAEGRRWRVDVVVAEDVGRRHLDHLDRRNSVLRQALVDDVDELDSVDSLGGLRLDVWDEVGLLQRDWRVTERCDELRGWDVGLIKRRHELRELVLRDAGDARDGIDGERHGYERKEVVGVEGARVCWDEREQQEKCGFSHDGSLCKEGTGSRGVRGEAEKGEVRIRTKI